MEPEGHGRAGQALQRTYVVGVKIGPLSPGRSGRPVERAVEAGTLANIPVMVDFGDVPPASGRIRSW